MVTHDMALDDSSKLFWFEQRRGGDAQFEIRLREEDGDQHGKFRGPCVAAGYRRWLSFDEPDLPGQDFCAFQFDDHHAIGVVADGVSQSFFGDIAARVVGRTLAEYLWKRRARPPMVEELWTELDGGQSKLIKAVSEQKLSENLDSVVRYALHEARREGSQTVFGGVVLDRRNNVANLYMLGDITAIVRYTSQDQESFSAEKRGRWSSAGGLRGEIRREPLHDVASVLLKSDGAADGWGEVLDEIFREDLFRDRAHKWADKDDVSFVWLAAGTAARSQREPPDPIVEAPDPLDELPTEPVRPIEPEPLPESSAPGALPPRRAHWGLMASVFMVSIALAAVLWQLWPGQMDPERVAIADARVPATKVTVLVPVNVLDAGAPPGTAAGDAGTPSQPGPTGSETRSELPASLVSLLSPSAPSDRWARWLLALVVHDKLTRTVEVTCRGEKKADRDGVYRETIGITAGFGLVARRFDAHPHRCTLQPVETEHGDATPQAPVCCSWYTTEDNEVNARGGPCAGSDKGDPTHRVAAGIQCYVLTVTPGALR